MLVASPAVEGAEVVATSEGTKNQVKVGVGALAILSLVNLVDGVDVSILRGVLPLIKDEFSLSDLRLGLLGTAFIIVHTFATIPSGWMADRYRRTRLIGYTMLSWSALSAFAAASINYWHLFFARSLLGIGQAIDDPSSTALLADYYPPRMRGRIFSVLTVTTFIGGGIGLGLAGLVGTQFGWRWAFLLVGVPGSVLAFLVFRLREPTRGESDGVVHSTPSPPAEKLKVRALVRLAYRDLKTEIRMIFGIRTMRYILVGVGTLLFTVSGVGYWLAVYHDRYSGMTLQQATAVTAGVLGVGGLVGTLGGGALADRVYGKGVGGRISLVSTGILICTALFIISYNVPVAPRLILQFLGVAAITSAVPGIRASMMDVVPVESRGVSASAFALVSGLFGNALAPPVVGWLSDLTHELVFAFYIVSPPIVIGSLILLRARHTIADDAAAIMQAIVARAAASQEPVE